MARRRKPRCDELLFVGTRGHVRAVSKRTGRMVWDVSLPETGYEIVTLLVEPDTVYAASRGLLFALEPATGEIRWKNGLSGLGYQHVTLATARGAAPDSLLVQVREREERRADA